MSLITNLVSCWELGEASGTRNDSVGSNHLTDNNTVLAAAGKVGDAADFEDSNLEYLSIADNVSVSIGDVSCAFFYWVKFESLDADMDVLSKDDEFSLREYLCGYSSSSSRLRFGAFQLGTGTFFQAVANNFGAPSTGVWYYVGQWHDPVADTLNIQVNNGTVDTTAMTGGISDNAADFNLGRRGGGHNYLDAMLDQVLFYNGGFPDATDRTQLYNSGNGLSYAAMAGAISSIPGNMGRRVKVGDGMSSNGQAS